MKRTQPPATRSGNDAEVAARDTAAPGVDEEWDSAIEAWSESLPIFDRTARVGRGGIVIDGDGMSDSAPVEGALPEEEASFFETPTTVVSPNAPFFDLDELPHVSPPQSFDGAEDAVSDLEPYVALVASEELDGNIFETEPPIDDPPPFPTDTLPEMAPAFWREDASRIVQLAPPASSVTASAASSVASSIDSSIDWLDLARLLEAERALTDIPDRQVALSLARVRVLEQMGQIDDAVAEADAAAAADPASPAAHRVRLCLAERIGDANDVVATQSLAALARLPHADQPYYRLVRAEWVLAGVGTNGGVAGSVSAPASSSDMASIPDGLARLLAEAELTWARPGDAASFVERAAHRVGGPFGAALLVAAARLNEGARDFQAAAEQRFLAARLDDSHAPGAIGLIRDVARLEPTAALTPLEEVMARLPRSGLRRSLARWGASIARRTGDVAAAWELVTTAMDGAQEQSDAIALARDRFDLLPATLSDAATIESVLAEHARHWPSHLAAVFRALRLADLGGGPSRGDALNVMAALERAIADQPDAVVIGFAAERMAARASEPAIRARCFDIWKRSDPARRAVAGRALADCLADAETGHDATSDGETIVDGVLREVLENDGASPVFWLLSARAVARKDFVTAADWLIRGVSSPAWKASTLALPLRELAIELLARAGATATATATATVNRMTEITPVATVTPIAQLVTQLATDDAGATAALRVTAERILAGGTKHPNAMLGLLARQPSMPFAAAADPSMDQSVLDQALTDVPLHPIALALALAEGRVRANDVLLSTLAGSAAAFNSEPWNAAAVTWAALAGDPGRALTFARAIADGAKGGEASMSPQVRLSATLARRYLALASPFDAAALALQLATVGGGVPALVAAAELLEHAGDGAAAREAYERAAALREPADRVGSPVLADVRLGLWRLGEGEFPLTAGDGHNATSRLQLLASVVAGGDRSALAVRLVDSPPHEDAATAPTHYVAAHIDAAAGGRRATTYKKSAIAFAPNTASDSPLAALLTADDIPADGRRLAHAALPGLADAARRLGDRRSAAFFLVEAARQLADAAAVTGTASPPAEERWLRDALEDDSELLVAALAWRRYLARAGRVLEAADAAAREADLVIERHLKVRALLRAAALATAASSVDVDRAVTYLRRALDVAPDNLDAFSRLREVYELGGRTDDLADLLALRLKVTSNPFEASALRLARAELLAGPLGDRARAKTELAAILEKQPQHVRALARLADLESEDGEDAAAAELLIRRAWVERSPEKLREIFLRLGRIYIRRLPDPKRAIGAYSRVLQLDPNNHEALDALSQLYVGLGENRNAAAITERLIAMEDRPDRQASYLIRLGHLAERSGDNFTAAAHFRRAAEMAPHSLDALWELARFLEKTRDVAGRRSLLDRAADDLRAAVLAAPSDKKLLASLVAVSRWRGRTVVAAAAAELAAIVAESSVPTSEASSSSPESLPAWATPPANGRRLTALANVAVDERTFPVGVPPAVRHLLRLLGGALVKGVRIDLAAVGFPRAQRIPAGRPPRDVFDQVAAELGGTGYELLLVPDRDGQPATMLSVPADPPSLLIGTTIVSLGAAAQRFVAGRTLRLATTHLDLLVSGTEAEAGAWLAALVRPFVPTYRNSAVPEELIAVRTARVNRALPRRLRHEVLPYALESSGSIDLALLRRAIRDGANRVGLLACGSIAASLRVIAAATASGTASESRADSLPPEIADSADPYDWARAVQTNDEARALLKFALSDEHDDLARALA